MPENAFVLYTEPDTTDITDGLDAYQLKELITLCNEPAEKDTISEEEFKKMFVRRTIPC